MTVQYRLDAIGPAMRPDARHAPGIDGISLLGDLLLALGMLLTTASQLRLGELPVGPGELCLVAWLTLMTGREMGRLGPVLTPGLSRMLIFWAVFAFAQGIGFMTASFSGALYDPHWVLHDMMAYPLLAAVSCLGMAGPGAASRLRRVAWLLVIAGASALALQMAAGWAIIRIPMIQPWYWERFRGWSANPNQLALLCAVLGLVSLHLAETAIRPGARLLAMVSMILSAYVGRLTGSDTFTLVLLASGPAFVVFKLWAWLSMPERGTGFPSASGGPFAFACIAVIGLPLLLASFAPLALVGASDAGSFARNLSKNGGRELGHESDLRFSLWAEAMQLGITSGFLGLGPGPHLEIPVSILEGRAKTRHEPEHVEHPEPLSVPNFEAHNSFLDLLTQGGLVAALDLGWILFVAARLAVRARLAGLATMVCGLGLFCMTGLVVRHPMFWFAITLCLAAESRTTQVAAAPYSRAVRERAAS